MKSPNQGTKSPIRSRICIKNSKITHHKAPIVPQVRIELDDLLNQAYKQLKNQPKKNLILGNQQDICIIDNDVLKDYINIVYSQYNITDPMKDDLIIKDRSKSISVSSGSSLNYMTPKKSIRMHKKDDKNLTKDKNKQKLAKLKIDMRRQLSSQEYVRNSNYKPITLKQNYQSQNQDQPKFPIKKQAKKLKIKLNRSSKMKASGFKSKSSLINQSIEKQAYIFCLFCDQKLQEKQIGKHSHCCEETLRFIQLYCRPSIQIIKEGVSLKISKVHESIFQQSSQLKVSAYHLQQAVQNYLQNPANMQDNMDPVSPIQKFRSQFSPLFRENRQKVEILQFYRQSVIMKCYRLIQYAEYLKKLKNKLAKIESDHFDNAEKQKMAAQFGEKHIGYACSI